MTRHPLRRENRFDVDGGLLDVIAPGVELVFLCTPNNPTGRLVDGALLRAAAEQCRAVGAVLAVDECFLPLSDGAGPGWPPVWRSTPTCCSCGPSPRATPWRACGWATPSPPTADF
ncbi:aminotransferase class I/II-fold pyridoxal phosphate-dependent enzyme [Flavonifractor plautii]|nr:aminotransferase class I/II-fold pyridoxal phosphate-dependent enzyme [Flavonifractor plautii]